MMAVDMLDFLAGGCGAAALSVLAGYLDLRDVLNLSLTCRRLRHALVSDRNLWSRLYDRDASRSSGPLSLTACSSDPSSSPCLYRLNASERPSQFAALLNLARRCGLLLDGAPVHGNHFLDLAISSAAAAKRTTIDRDVLKKLELASTPHVAGPNLQCGYGAPFTVASKARFFGFDARGEFFAARVFAPVTDETKLSVVSCSWVRQVSSPRCSCNTGACRTNATTNRSRSDPVTRAPQLAVLYVNGGRETMVSVYEYGPGGFSDRPCATYRVSAGGVDVTCFDVSSINACGHHYVFVGTRRGTVYARSPCLEQTCSAANVAIEGLQASAYGREWLLCAQTAEKSVAILRLGTQLKPFRHLAEVSSFAFDADGLVLGHCSDRKCKVNFGAVSGPAAEIGVSKPPSQVIFLHRMSLWAVAIRNYLKLVQVSAAGEALVVKHVRALNGHRTAVTVCHTDGWSRLATLDASRCLIIWDFVRGVKVVSMLLHCAVGPAPGAREFRDTASPIKSRKRPSVNRQLDYALVHNAKKNFNTPPSAAAREPPDSDDEGDVVAQVRSMELHALPKVAERYSVHLSQAALCVYYHHLSCIQLVTLK
ncbi:F-box only protein 7-like protein [Babesia caballi]|uniref:F-box only protein 7-like protein n=1 Tax=Babesia caballi TaxID=5871 RepID=A0AAV4LS28_BABCB|nr:F-box only protein 7-like protein [Babesia caballi]